MNDHEVVGESAAILAAMRTAEQIAPTAMPVLIVGETGTGKELLAQHIHRRSNRKGDLVCVDCGSLPEGLTESLLYGHDKGAFTGAIRQSRGLIAQAHEGTLFLDELGNLPRAGQAKLLRVLETGEVRRLGSSSSRPMDFRIVATVQEDFPEVVDRGDFRLDLLQRVAGVIIRLPPLNDRGGDIALLARHFARQAGATISSAAEKELCRQAWPGNVRELRWTVVRAAQLATDGCIEVDAVRNALDLGPSALLSPRDSARERTQRLRAACEIHRGDPVLIARSLQIGRSTLYRWLEEERLDLKLFRAQAMREGLRESGEYEGTATA